MGLGYRDTYNEAVEPCKGVLPGTRVFTVDAEHLLRRYGDLSRVTDTDIAQSGSTHQNPIENDRVSVVSTLVRQVARHVAIKCPAYGQTDGRCRSYDSFAHNDGMVTAVPCRYATTTTYNPILAVRNLIKLAQNEVRASEF